ncbi:Helix-turn-helix domain-containing protein [Planctomicrobium piriforme]|uniref:Helix-turn-helix domain-containing protein n=2 Tax=Planctomicrobium piriforme TaxID=1576369 RepID=A0A1I3J2F7_9PLAN|nr:Helix-turn-helix domain-containing protein [Planctomicrobium piriforme]
MIRFHHPIFDRVPQRFKQVGNVVHTFKAPEMMNRPSALRSISKADRARSFERDLLASADARSEGSKQALDLNFRASPRRPFVMNYGCSEEAQAVTHSADVEAFCELRLHLNNHPALHDVNYSAGWMRRMPGSFIFTPPGKESQVRGNRRNRFESLLVSFPVSELREIAGDYLETDGQHLLRVPNKELLDPVVPALIRQLWDQLDANSIGEEIMAEGTFLTLIGRLLTLEEKKKLAFAEQERGSSHMVDRAMAYMQDTLAEKPSLGEIAAAAGVSRPQLTRAFRKATGQTVHDHLVQLRIRRVKELIGHFGRNMTFDDMAKECGFSNRGHLSRVFTQMVGVTPEQYRRQI